SGLPWVPGTGNRLASGGRSPNLATVAAIAGKFVVGVAPLLGVDPAALKLSEGRSGEPASGVWFVDYDVLAGGLPIEGARVVFRVTHGNLVQFGGEDLPSPGAKVPAAKLTREQAYEVLKNRLAQEPAGQDDYSDRGSEHVIPIAIGQPSNQAPGKGRGLARVWQFVFRRAGALGTWRARIDAATGELLEFRDINLYIQAQATGGLYLESPSTGSEVVRPLPFADLSIGGFSSTAGFYNWTSGALTSALNGEYVKMVDSCGPISLSADGSGNLNFGTSGGTDCTTPGFGGAGNTHAARQQFWGINRIKEMGRGWLPGNVWLGQQLTVNVNLTGTCNAFWSPTSHDLNFYQSFGTCKNTGENSGVTFHEFGHGLDTNDGNGFSPDNGTGESTADVTAFLALHDSCIGPGTLASNCMGYGDACTSCSGFRDVDWAKHSSNTPHTVANFTQTDCGSSFYAGECGGEGHCESYVSSEAMWDFVNRDLPGAGTDPAWTVGDRLWYTSRSTASAAFSCNTSGATYTSNGCGVGSWFEVFRLMDDDDGNLANGTPHGGAIYAAFNRHGIACTSDPGGSTTFSSCSPPAVPTVTLTPGTNQVMVSWTSSGAGVVYDVFRNEVGCNSTFTRIVTATSSTSYADMAVANGTTYHYEVVAYPSGNPSCAAASSTCLGADLTGPDPSITPWGAALSPPTPPYWQTPDIWVDNNGNGIPNEPGEPSLNKADNHLFARITNVGNAPASGYRVHFAAKPYTTSSSAPAFEIGTQDEAGTLAPGASKSYTLLWDLTPATIASEFPGFPSTDHFCVQVNITSSSGSPLVDADLTNNFAQNNFDNIPMMGIHGIAQAHFLIYNHLEREAVAGLTATIHAQGWKVRFEKLGSAQRIVLKPRQWMDVVAIAEPGPNAELPRKGHPVMLDIAQTLNGKTVGGLTMGIVLPFKGGSAPLPNKKSTRPAKAPAAAHPGATPR
ncbi:MAG TPA: hypothetical protein VIH93_06295, partial [Thermoanaerobaculia bacterium]